MADTESKSAPYCMQDAHWASLAQPETGHVYFIGGFDPECGCIALIKIGYSKDPGYRFTQIRATMGPYRAELMATCPGGRDREWAYHDHFATFRNSGEWFHPAKEILTEIERLGGGL